MVFDDYFYPYPLKNRDGRELDFPDDASWKKYGVPGGLTREDWRRENVNQLRPKNFAGNQSRETVGAIWHQPVRHLATAKSAAHQGLWTPTEKFTPTRGSGWRTAGWIFSRRSFTGPSRRVNKVFPCCSTGGARKTRKAAMSSPRWMTPLSVKNFRRMKSHGRFRTFARRRASAAKFITICAISRTMPRSPPPCNRNMPSRRSCRLRRGWIPRRRKNRRCLLPRKIPSRQSAGFRRRAQRRAGGCCKLARTKFGRRKFCLETSRAAFFTIQIPPRFHCARWIGWEI